MKTLTIIPARSGSKGIPNKNMIGFCEKALIRWTIDQAKAAGLTDIIVATDAQEYKDKLDLWYPEDNLCRFLLPKKVTKDNVRSNIYLTWVLDWVRDNMPDAGFDTVLLLEPTAPLRCGGDIGSALAEMKEKKANAIVAVCDDDRAHPALSYRLGRDSFLEPGIDTPHFQRQQLDPFFHLTGTLYAANIPWYREHQTFISEETVGYKVNKWQDHEIDYPWDLKIVSSLITMIE
jgi:CMP-N,N'-diacetyllegionaminic acid synthase